MGVFRFKTLPWAVIRLLWQGWWDRASSLHRLPADALRRIVAFLPATHRRIDIKSYPATSYPFAILYFTGSDHFNRSMRLYSKQIG